ncbi:PAS domain-containing sensor histidine kinase [Vibrio fluvialis]|nr:PAS domain-containing sensor histidine kinase [Vibrio fluvialis]
MKKQLELMEDNISVLFWIGDDTGKIIYISDETKDYFGSDYKIIKDNWLDFVHIEDKRETQHKWEYCVKNKQKYHHEFRLKRYDGKYIWHRVTATPGLDKSNNLVWFGRIIDISEIKELIYKIDKSRSFFQNSIDSITDIYVIFDKDYNVVHANKKSEFIFKNELNIKSKLIELLGEKHFNKIRLCFFGENVSVEIYYPDLDSYYYCSFFGNENQITLYIKDVSIIKKLNNQNGILEDAFNTSNEMTLIIENSSNYPIIKMNRSIKEHIKTVEEKTYLSEIFDLRNVNDNLTDLLRHEQPFELKVVLRESSKYTYNLDLIPIKHSELRKYTYWIIKVFPSEESEFSHKENRIEDIGYLSSGIAHDLRNYLTAIIGNTDLLIQMNEKNDRYNEILKHIMYAAKNSATLSTALHKFSKSQSFCNDQLNVINEIKSITKFLQSSPNFKSHIILDISIDIWPLFIDVSNFNRLITNLLLNSERARNLNDPKILITGYNITISNDDDILTHENASVGEYICLEVTDNGVGIPSENIEKIFMPFFTTSDKQEGAGIGLNIVSSIVDQLNGFILVDSVVNVGTTFSIYLPKQQDQSYEEQ